MQNQFGKLGGGYRMKVLGMEGFGKKKTDF